MRKWGSILGVVALALTWFTSSGGIERLVVSALDSSAPSVARFGELPGEYSAAVEATYMSGCESQTGDVPFCHCTLAKMQNAYTEDEYLAIDARVAMDPAALPERIQVIYRRCLRQAAGAS